MRSAPTPVKRRNFPSVRGALTLVELLVVIAIIAVLLGLLIPAVQQVRAAASRVQCSHHLRELGLALQNYHDTHKILPPGCSYLNGKSAQPHMSWLTRLLPFIEQDTLWGQSLSAFKQDTFFETPPHFPICQKVMPAFLCPSDPRSQQAEDFTVFSVAFTDYLGVWGTDRRHRDGVLFIDSQVRLADVRDGTSNTLMVGERPPSADGRLGWWYAGWGQLKDGSAEALLGVAEWNDGPFYRQCPRGPYSYGPGRNANQCDTFHFWSLHPGGANFLFCDGSVHFLPYSAAPIMPALATRAGGEAVSVPN
jgi:prepilin-type processing-associated H-X9-DG protein/prepilin-type N-terminal cleavage/methylation domain-containing protein